MNASTCASGGCSLLCVAAVGFPLMGGGDSNRLLSKVREIYSGSQEE